MKKAEWQPLVERIAMARHKMWCGAAAVGTERKGRCGHEAPSDLNADCTGPSQGDYGIARAIAIELWGEPEDADQKDSEVAG